MQNATTCAYGLNERVTGGQGHDVGIDPVAREAGGR
jgi:hypothetical protein